MKRYVLTPRAKRDVNDIWDYIASDNIEAADRVLDALESAMVKLAKSPGIGHRRDALADERHRFWMVYSYLIVYRHETKPLQIPMIGVFIPMTAFPIINGIIWGSGSI